MCIRMLWRNMCLECHKKCKVSEGIPEDVIAGILICAVLCRDDCLIFEDFVANSTNNVLLFKVQVPGCLACATLAPRLEELAAQYPDFIFINVNYMEVWSSLLDYNITVVPTCVFVWKTEEVARVMTTNKYVVENQIIATKKDLNLT